MSRYITEKRVGCIAVIDTEMFDPNHQGLHQDDCGVVRFWEGVNGPKGWHVPIEDQESAERLVKELNEVQS